MKKFLLILIISLLLVFCGERITSPSEDLTITSLNYKNLQASHQVPMKIQYLFSLRNQDDRAVIISENNLNNVTLDISENGIPIDPNESSAILHSSNDFGLEVSLVLDFSKSMKDSGGIPEMILGAEAVINSLTETHKISIIEFHDNNQASNFSIIQPFTTDKELAIEKLNEFAQEVIYNGFSTCWDAVNLGLEQFDATIDSSIVRSLIFISDGNDNSSVTTPTDLTTSANDKNVRIYNIGFNLSAADSSNTNQIATLENLSLNTGGQSYFTEDVTFIQEKFNDIVEDLGGNYKISYITPKSEPYELAINLTYKNIPLDTPISATIDPTNLQGSDRQGLINFTEPILTANSLIYFIQASHIPRFIDSLRFSIDYPETNIEIVAQDEGGLLNNWSIPLLDDENYWNTSGECLEFGDFGTFFKVTHYNINAAGVTIPIHFDNSIYGNDTYFFSGDETELDSENNWHSEISFGVTIGNPNPNNFSTEIDTLPQLSWEVLGTRDSLLFDVFLDTLSEPSNQIVADSLQTNYQLIEPLEKGKTYYWKVIGKNENTINSPIWNFTTIQDTI